MLLREELQSRVIALQEYNDGLSARAKLWNTFVNSIEYREGMTKDLTDFQNHFHEKITKLTDHQLFLRDKLSQCKNIPKTTKQLKQLELELAQFKIDYFSVMDDNAYHYRYKGHTSDNTKVLELRPNKRHPHTVSSLDNNRQLDSVKKSKLNGPDVEGSTPSTSL